ncbi:SpoIIE family protein phosphatase [Amycolatopsis suaedae]|uniref:Serine/threonine protein kinase n=1 Tax=Amycolatopsis suaedae TaxID=2510978 RepID=A0A4Q7J111_9PSEU|nr:SpoIIE family protein phosphatase [Amycolatopsis suaedae]RZQ60507.1 serine/threonine protein kinase [Amycolatopsis suaedae]
MRGTALAVREQAHVGQARRYAVTTAGRAGLPRPEQDRIAVVASELATNLLKYAIDGMFTAVPRSGGVDLLATDRGPGIPRLAESMRDGYSTTGTLGTGLGAVRRMADRFDIYSGTEGTTVLARWHPSGAEPRGIRFGAVLYSAPGEDISGDAWAVVDHEDLTTVAISDGLGHGPAAARASELAMARVQAEPGAEPEQLVRAMATDLAVTRGATVALARIDRAAGTLRFTGVGNTTARLYSSRTNTSTQLVSAAGFVGDGAPVRDRVRSQTHAWTVDSKLVLHTDGIAQRWKAEDRPELFGHDPAVVAGWLLGQYCRGRDDACAVVAAGGEHR